MKRMLCFLLGAGWLWCASLTSVEAKPVQLQRVHINASANHMAAIFDFSGKFEYHQFRLAKPSRLVIDMPNAKLLASLKNAFQPIDIVKNFRHSGAKQSNLRLVFDLTEPAAIKVLSLRRTSHQPYRLMVQFPPNRAKAVAAHPRVVAVTHAPAVIKKSIKKRPVIVVIDPGHGGKDPGAKGPHGAREKAVVLQIARRLQAMLNKEPGFKAILTRKGDYYIGLRHRLALAHKYKADMFVAIHADAYRHQHAHGASVYALSERGATSEAARWLAKRENESEFVGGLDLADKDHVLRSVLIDLSQTHTISASLQMGDTILQQLSKFAQLHHEGVEQAAFVVLKSPDIPSLLVETGFLSNPREEAKLTKSHYQQRIAQAVMQGIKGYFISHPPRGTTLSHYPKQESSRYG